MNLRVIIPALPFLFCSFAMGAEARYPCTHLMRLEDPLGNLKRGFFEQAVNWAAFEVPPNQKLSTSLMVRQLDDEVTPQITVEVKTGPEVTRLPCDLLTLCARHLPLLKARIESGKTVLTPLEQRAADVNQNYQMGVDMLKNGLAAPVPPKDPRYPLFRHGFEVFTEDDTAFLLSGDYRWLALCPADGMAVELRGLRDRTFLFMTNPAVMKLLDCEDLLSYPGKTK